MDWNAVRNGLESLSAINWNPCPQSQESAPRPKPKAISGLCKRGQGVAPPVYRGRRTGDAVVLGRQDDPVLHSRDRYMPVQGWAPVPSAAGVAGRPGAAAPRSRRPAGTGRVERPAIYVPPCSETRPLSRKAAVAADMPSRLFLTLLCHGAPVFALMSLVKRGRAARHSPPQSVSEAIEVMIVQRWRRSLETSVIML